MAETQSFYTVENIVGNARTRAHRHRSACVRRNKQYIAGRRTLPGKKITFSEEIFQREAAKLLWMLKEGMIVLTAPGRLRITYASTGEFILSRPDGAFKALPKGELPECFQKVKPEDQIPATPETTTPEEVEKAEEILEEIAEEVQPEVVEVAPLPKDQPVTESVFGSVKLSELSREAKEAEEEMSVADEESAAASEPTRSHHKSKKRR